MGRWCDDSPLISHHRWSADHLIVMGNFILWDAKTLGFIDYPALHYPLIGLGNRLLFNTKLSLEIALNQQLGSFLAVLFLDLDRFKTINDT